MAKDSAVFICQSCGGAHSKWSGRCDACGAWNTLVQEASSAPPGAMAATPKSRARGLVFETLESQSTEPARIKTGIEEFDRVCGGGVVRSGEEPGPWVVKDHLIPFVRSLIRAC